MIRDIITIDESRCDGCGLCAQGCPEGALQIVDGVARLVGDLLCDGLGACIGSCPRGAIAVERREAEPYDERRVMKENIIPKGSGTIEAHLRHLLAHGEDRYLKIAIAALEEAGLPTPSSLRNPPTKVPREEPAPIGGLKLHTTRPLSPSDGAPRQAQWPIQLHLVNPRASHFEGASLLLAADCAGFSVPDFRTRWAQSKSMAIACPKLDTDLDRYLDKLVVLIDEAKVKDITVLRMQVPCCGGLVRLAVEARNRASRAVPITAVIVDPEGRVLKEEPV